MKKFLSCLVSVGVLASIMTSLGASSTSAATSVLLGDTNNNGSVTYADLANLQQYLLGYGPTTARGFTAMDVNQDKIIDNTDAYIIQYRLAYNISAPTVQKELYTLPDNSTREYIKYTCDTGTTTTYTLSNSMTGINADINYPTATASSDTLDRINLNVVHLSCGGSGIVISEHLIATAAHCVYNTNSEHFEPNLTVNIYNESAEVNSSNLIASFEAESYHIPDSFLENAGGYSNDYNYDYALIYVGTDSRGNDLLDYVTPWQFAIPSLEFSEAQIGQLTSSGFTTHDDYARFLSTGTVKDFSNDVNETHNNPQLRIASTALCPGGKSGGAMYYISSCNSTSNKSIAGILTSGSDNYPTWATVINPTLLRFYKQNPYI